MYGWKEHYAHSIHVYCAQINIHSCITLYNIWGRSINGDTPINGRFKIEHPTWNGGFGGTPILEPPLGKLDRFTNLRPDDFPYHDSSLRSRCGVVSPNKSWYSQQFHVLLAKIGLGRDTGYHLPYHWPAVHLFKPSIFINQPMGKNGTSMIHKTPLFSPLRIPMIHHDIPIINIHSPLTSMQPVMIFPLWLINIMALLTI